MKALSYNDCPFCEYRSKQFYEGKFRVYFKCANCLSVFMHRDQLPDSELEKKRYLEHNNDVYDSRYRAFVKPIVDAVISNFSPADIGLDYGAGTGPVISKMLKENNYNIIKYDPFFFNFPELLKNKYNYITSCEVIEHFHNPKNEFEYLRRMLLPGGKLFCMTEIYDESIDFNRWYYKNDQTHVVFYHKKTFEWLKDKYNFADLIVDGRLITFVA